MTALHPAAALEHEHTDAAELAAFPKLEHLRAAEEAIERHDYEAAVRAVEGWHPSAADFPELALRALLAESWAWTALGEVEAGLALLERARALAERPPFSDVDRAEVLYRAACCRLELSEVAAATSLLTVALELCERSSSACDQLRAQILARRSCCYQRRRDWDAARGDIELGLELARSLDDPKATAALYTQAASVAERQEQWLLARFYGEHALDLYKRCSDQHELHRTLNRLGRISVALQEHEQAQAWLLEALALAEELESDEGAASSLSALAWVHVAAAAPDAAEASARRALELLGELAGVEVEAADAQLVLGRALLEQERFDEAELAFRSAELSAEERRVAAWLAQGDLAARRGDLARAAGLYRRAATSLQDVHF